MSESRNVIFLPGVSGDGGFWKGVGGLLPAAWNKRYLDWPGLGRQPASPDVNGFADLLALAEAALDRPAAIVAQSMGGIIATQLALKHPRLVTQLVLVATSGGMDVSVFGAADWRADFVQAYPDTPAWALNEKPDLGAQFAQIVAPTLLLWGDDDPISPVAIGRHLAAAIPKAELQRIPGGRHSMGADLPQLLAPRIEAHIAGA
ncbi:alpha/beta fold hydrolase [Massilia aerilata]|uniref:Alpha/beta fold hydrolase n=1 Tax=Massilia aerilata TaxID=453817 RepID=A0ABW0RX03_9BURK